MTLQEQYIELQKYRTQQPSDILINKKRKIWEYFRHFVNVSNLEKNISNKFSLFFAPLKQIHGATMVCWPVGDTKEIYVDEDFVKMNPELTSVQLTHEVLHGLSQFKVGKQHIFGHECKDDSALKYTGIDEATTQMFTEDIEKRRLSKEEDYLYFLKNIMRVMKALFGKEIIANQYLNNGNQFEEEFNKLTSYKFEPFVVLMNEVYILTKKYRHKNITEEQLRQLLKKQQTILDFIYTLIQQYSQINSDIIDQICNEVIDEKFLQNLNIASIERQNYCSYKNR